MVTKLMVALAKAPVVTTPTKRGGSLRPNMLAMGLPTKAPSAQPRIIRAKLPPVLRVVG